MALLGRPLRNYKEMGAPPNRKPNKNGTTLIIFLILTSCTFPGRCQSLTPEVINFSGWDYSYNTFHISSSLGEFAVQTIIGSGGIITQGFLQPEVRPPCSNIQINYFPNPVENIITIRDTACGRLVKKITVIDLFGKEVLHAMLRNRSAHLEQLHPGLYIVTAYSRDNSIMGTFKIVKITNP